MENTLAQIRIIQTMGITGGPLRPNLVLPMIAARAIGAAAAQALWALLSLVSRGANYSDSETFALTELAGIVGSAIGKPDLKYVQLPDEQVRTALTQMGVSLNVANLILEMAAALNSGHMRPLEVRFPENTTPTSYESFVGEEFVPRYRGQSTTA
jgi:hypothetical protein